MKKEQLKDLDFRTFEYKVYEFPKSAMKYDENHIFKTKKSQEKHEKEWQKYHEQYSLWYSSFQNIPEFPVGTVLKLKTGEIKLVGDYNTDLNDCSEYMAIEYGDILEIAQLFD